MDETETHAGAEHTTGRGVGASRMHNPHRLNALADGVFAIAMTLLALEIKIPADVSSSEELGKALGPLLTSIGVFAAAFFITAQYWLGHHRVMSYVHTVDAKAAQQTVLALFGVAALPIAASLMTNLGQFPQAVTIAATILIVTSLLSVRLYAHVLRPEFSDIDAVTRRRTILAPLLNAGVYLLSIVLAIGLSVVDVKSFWALLIWWLLPFNRMVTNRIVRG